MIYFPNPLLGFISYFLFMYLNKRVMNKFFGMELLEPIDEIFMYESDKNVANIMSCFIIEKF